MAKFDEQLVKRIADQIMAAMQPPAQSASADGTTPAPKPNSPKPAASTPARLHPPVGVCTGDYSKFAELLGQPIGGQRATIEGGQAANTLQGFVTAQQLEAAIKTAPDGIARLAANARLTPLAADFARKHPEKVHRANQSPQPAPSGSTSKQAAPSATTTAATPTPWLWWADGHCPAVQSLASEHRTHLRPSAAPRSDLGLVEVVRDLAAMVDSRRVQGGLLFVRSAARAVCYANRCKTLRAIVGTCAETVDEGITQLGANVLVIEYPHNSPAAMGEMVNRLLAQPPQVPANVARHLTDLHCR